MYTGDEINELTSINDKIRDAEWSRNVTYMKSLLDDTLVFKRASGVTVNKETYLNELQDPNNSYSELKNVSIDVKIDSSDKAVVTVIVHAAGNRGKDKTPFNGTFRNIRYFRKNAEWRLYKWENEKLADPDP